MGVKNKKSDIGGPWVWWLFSFYFFAQDFSAIGIGQSAVPQIPPEARVEFSPGELSNGVGEVETIDEAGRLFAGIGGNGVHFRDRQFDRTAEIWIGGANVYDITNFIERHPGGEDILLFAAGRDATQVYLNNLRSADFSIGIIVWFKIYYKFFYRCKFKIKFCFTIVL